MGLNINEFKANFKYGGMLTNQFEVLLTNPINGAGDNILPFRCKAANIPSKPISPIPVSYQGRQVKMPGVTEAYEPWTITILEDEDFVVRNALEEWANAINSPVNNRRETPSAEVSEVKSTALFTLLSKNETPLRTYKMVGIFPTNVGEVSVDWGNQAIMEYPVTFEVDYWEIDTSSITGLAGGPNI